MEAYTDYSYDYRRNGYRPKALAYPSPKKTEWFLMWHNGCDHVREQLLSLSENICHF